MKQLSLLAAFIFVVSVDVNAQTNTFPTPTGNVGINVSSPLDALHINGNIRLNYGNRVGVGLTDGFTYDTKFQPHYGLQWTPDTWYPTGPSLWMSGYGGMKFFTGANVRMAIAAGGGVGIGTITPTEKLEVVGNVMSHGALRSTRSTALGGSLELVNSGKTAAGAATRWAIYNMSENYGNSLQFWAYDQTGCATGGMCLNRFTITDAGNVGIGTQTPTAKLTVVGGISAQKIKVSATNAWPDYVFESSYALPSLKEVERYIQQYKHLPDVPSAKEVDENGLDLGDNQAVLLKKIEELTLYMIAQEKRTEALEAEVKRLKAEKK